MAQATPKEDEEVATAKSEMRANVEAGVLRESRRDRRGTRSRRTMPSEIAALGHNEVTGASVGLCTSGFRARTRPGKLKRGRGGSSRTCINRRVKGRASSKPS